jgi:hypothetical protein
MKRKFNSQRLYKLLIFVVIIVTILCIYGYYNNTKFYNSLINSYSKDVGNCWKQYDKDLLKPSEMPSQVWNKMDSVQKSVIERQFYPDVQKSAQKAENDCASIMPATDLKMESEAMTSAEQDINIAILLPLIFILCICLYKYLFPKIK